MSQLQLFLETDDLANFKLNRSEQYGCLFFEHNINRTVDIGQGVYENNTYQEEIITDGNISLNRKNFNMPLIVYKNQLLKMKDGLSIPITLRNASFYILKTKIENEKSYDIEYSIHCNEESEELLSKIIRYLYNREYDLFTTESVKVLDKETIRLITQTKNIPKEEFISLAPKENKRKIKRR